MCSVCKVNVFSSTCKKLFNQSYIYIIIGGGRRRVSAVCRCGGRSGERSEGQWRRGVFGRFWGARGWFLTLFEAIFGDFLIFFEKSWSKICGIEKSVVILHRFSAHETLVRVSYIFDASCERSRKANVLWNVAMNGNWQSASETRKEQVCFRCLRRFNSMTKVYR